MKKKLNLSVVDIINRVTVRSPKNIIKVQAEAEVDRKVTMQQPLIINQPVRFQDLYRKVINQKEKCKYGDNGVVKVVYDSKRVTPVQTCRVKRSSCGSISNTGKGGVNSIVNTGKKSNISTAPMTNIQPQRKSSKQSIYSTSIRNSKQKPVTSHSHSQSIKPSLATSIDHKPLQILRPIKNQSQTRRILNIEQFINQLDHEEHSHLRERNQCFLTERQIDKIMGKMGYVIDGDKYWQFLKLLQVDIYGGAPAENFKELLKVIQGKMEGKEQMEVSLDRCQISEGKFPKIINNNLQLVLDEQKQEAIRKYFRNFALNAQIISIEKQNIGTLSNITNKKRTKSFQKILKQQLHRNCMPKQFESQYSSPKKIKNSVISDLIEALALSDTKKSNQKQNITMKLQSLKKQQQYGQQPIKQQQLPQEQNMNTFRKIQDNGFDVYNVGDYNFSRQLSGDKEVNSSNIDGQIAVKEDDNIIQLKNRLNEALKKSNFENNQFAQDEEYSGFVYTNSSKYSHKPVLSVDVNLGEGLSQKIIVFQGQTAKQVSERLAKKFTISNETKNKFQKMLQSHLNTMLWKIDEVSQDMLTDREPQ